MQARALSHVLTVSTVPPEIEHSLIWTRLPIFPPSLPPPSESPLSARLHQDGLWGFTGSDSPPPSPSLLPECLPSLADWGITMDKLVRSPRGSDEEEQQVKEYGLEIETFIKRRWIESEWETAWFVNPPVSVLQSQWRTAPVVRAYLTLQLCPSGCKACLGCHISMSLHVRNAPRRSQGTS